VLCKAEDKHDEAPDRWFRNGQSGLNWWPRELTLPDEKITTVCVAIASGVFAKGYCTTNVLLTENNSEQHDKH
jgi:uncharacterized protein YaeQ